MNCFYHNGQPAVAQCTDCGKHLCRACASNFQVPLCKDCAKVRNASQRKKAIEHLFVLVIGLTLGIGYGIWTYHHPSGIEFDLITCVIGGAIAGITVVGIPTGWRALSRITPNIFLFLPLIGWVIYFLIKGLLSVAVGLILFPINTVKGIVLYIKAEKMEHYIDEKFSN